MKKAFYEENFRTVVDEFEGFFSFQDFKEKAIYANNLRVKKKCNSQVVVLEELKVMTKEIRDWIESEWFPNAVRSNLRYMAFVVPKSAIAEYSVRSANEKAENDSPTKMAYFASIAEAYSWINSVA